MMDKLDRQIIKHKQKAYAHPHASVKRQVGSCCNPGSGGVESGRFPAPGRSPASSAR